MKIIRDKVTYGRHFAYGTFPTDVLNDNRISPMAFRLLCVLLNCHQGRYRPTIKSLAKQFKVSTQKIDRAVKELKQYGYLKSTGSRTDTIWNVHPIPVID